jgi:hypothetical protein
MILKLIFITILSTTIHAEDLTGKYMIEDSLHEFSKINKFQENNFCGTQEQVGDEKITPIKMEMPKLLTAEFFKLKEICEDSKKNHQEKKIAFLMFKTHMCDRGSKACLYNTRTMVDPCNKFLQDNFSIYHTRMFRYKTLKSPSEEMPKQQEMFDEWEKYGIEGGWF